MSVGIGIDPCRDSARVHESVVKIVIVVVVTRGAGQGGSIIHRWARMSAAHGRTSSFGILDIIV
uniref:Uncharacterized protein n=1 Tax=Candidatus Kentrum sp. SD TaxID=2126332 RepID=A0A450YCQ3_9GAMM|nr:MAG: hypothetical protein BECKSD772F_GA0070984_103526 [Candidatus Kentron sp. SD]VFK44121.1 MAG: hypothetical protein BECKSD772E_GA0070983_103326 [Candidatus Kentron sp. SD]VFK79123.1 MAG: hypothetical protein BECKSD772D_GA0070982_103625 [Candidatus Kentron sp. SD]